MRTKRASAISKPMSVITTTRYLLSSIGASELSDQAINISHFSTWNSAIFVIAVFVIIFWMGLAIHSVSVTANATEKKKPLFNKKAFLETWAKATIIDRLIIFICLFFVYFVVSSMFYMGHPSACPPGLLDEYCLKFQTNGYIVVPKWVYMWAYYNFIALFIALIAGGILALLKKKENNRTQDKS